MQIDKWYTNKLSTGEFWGICLRENTHLKYFTINNIHPIKIKVARKMEPWYTFLYLVIKGHKILKYILKIVFIGAKEWIYGGSKHIFV